MGDDRVDPETGLPITTRQAMYLDRYGSFRNTYAYERDRRRAQGIKEDNRPLRDTQAYKRAIASLLDGTHDAEVAQRLQDAMAARKAAE